MIWHLRTLGLFVFRLLYTKKFFLERRKYNTFSNVRTRNSKIEFPVEDDIQFGLFSSGRKVGTRKEGIKKNWKKNPNLLVGNFVFLIRRPCTNCTYSAQNMEKYWNYINRMCDGFLRLFTIILNFFFSPPQASSSWFFRYNFFFQIYSSFFIKFPNLRAQEVIHHQIIIIMIRKIFRLAKL